LLRRQNKWKLEADAAKNGLKKTEIANQLLPYCRETVLEGGRTMGHAGALLVQTIPQFQNASRENGNSHVVDSAENGKKKVKEIMWIITLITYNSKSF
jgi:hypothetical protein